MQIRCLTNTEEIYFFVGFSKIGEKNVAFYTDLQHVIGHKASDGI